MKAFGGIGSRDITDKYAIILLSISRKFAEQGYWLRTGAAIGADQSCAIGAGKNTILYLPWKNYEKEWVESRRELGSVIGCIEPSKEAIKLASEVHPAWDKCSNGAQLLHGRNAHIILGRNLSSPVEFVLYYSQTIGHEIIPSGTGLGVAIARKYSIPLYNVNDPRDIASLTYKFGKL